MRNRLSERLDVGKEEMKGNERESGRKGGRGRG
jgi:hypothetical protein